MAEVKPIRVNVTAVVYGDISYDNRVLRQASTLDAEGYAVTIVCAYAPRRDLTELPASVTVVVEPPASKVARPATDNPLRNLSRTPRHGKLRLVRRTRAVVRGLVWAARYLRDLRRWGDRLKRRYPETTVWHLHDLPALVALSSRTAKLPDCVIYDSHELFVESGSAARLPESLKKLLVLYEGRLCRRAAGVITVNEGIAAIFRSRHRIEPAVVMNCPPIAAQPERAVLRDRLGLGSRPIVLYHGSLGRGRGLEAFLRAMPLLPPDIWFVVLGEGSLGEWLLAEADHLGVGDRVRVHGMVAPSELRSWLVDANIGIVLFEATEQNHVVASPNKLFEFMNANVPVLASDFPVMRSIIEDAGAGLVCNPSSPADVADKVSKLLSPAVAYSIRQRAQQAVERGYSWETQGRILTATYARVALSPRPDDDRCS